MNSFDHQSWLANGDDGDDNDPAEARAAALGANSLRHFEMIDFFAAERERMPARRRSPDHHDGGLEMLAANVNTASTSPLAPVIYDDDEEEKGEMAAVQAELQRINEDNQRLRSMINQMYALLQHAHRSSSSASSSSSSSTPSPDAHDVPWPSLLDPSGPPNPAAMRGRGEVGPVDDGGLPNIRKRKEVVVDAASSEGEESSEDDDKHHDQNSNNKLKKASAMRKPRVIVRIRTDTDDLNGTVKIDGCQWRKYGQKISKSTGNTPRCYYRCSMANECPMRKHLQKYAGDDLIVDVTYQGAHNHPLPQEAVPMARATAAALEMVMSGSMPFGEGLMDTSALAATMPPGARATRTATVSTLSPFPSALLDLSKSPDPARSQGQPPAAQFPATFPVGTAPVGLSHLIQKSVEMLAAPPYTDFLRGGGGGGGGSGNGGI